MLQAIFSTLTALLMALAALAPAQTNGQARPEAKLAANPARDSVIRIVEQIKRADYEGDRVALKRLHGDITALPGNRMLASSKVILARLCPAGAGQSTALTSRLLPKTWRKT
jgi:hypothetical protein